MSKTRLTILKPKKTMLGSEYLRQMFMPIASKDNFGIVKIGDGLQISDGVLSNDRTTDWGKIGGTLSDQTDLFTALESKVPKTTTINGKALTTNITLTTSDLANDSGYITNTVNNLTNYYLKTETYTKAEVQAQIAAIKFITIEIVASLPTPSAQYEFNTSRTIYMVKNQQIVGDLYDEYICIYAEGAYSWEKLGDTGIDLSAYVKKTTTIAGISLSDNISVASLQTALGWSDKQDTLVSGTNIKTINNQNLLGSGNIEVSAVATWGNITGTLSQQTDLQTVLDTKNSVTWRVW